MDDPTPRTSSRQLSIPVAGLLTAVVLIAIELGLGGLRPVFGALGLGRQALVVTFVLGASMFLAVIAGAMVLVVRTLPRITVPTVRVVVAAAVAVGTGILLRDLFHGPKASKLPLVAAYPWVLGLLAAAGCDLIARVARWRLPAGGILALLVAATAAVLDARVWPGLYPAFHGYLDLVVLAAIPIGAVLVSPAMPERARAPLRLAAFILGLAGAGAAWEIGRDVVLAGEIRRAGLVIGGLLTHESDMPEAPAAEGPPDDSVAEAHRAAAELHRAAVPAAASRPSILLVTVDALRADRGPGSAGGASMMPQVSEWAAKGALFTRAYSAAVSTFPSCRATLTGRYPDTTEKDPLLPEVRVIPGELQKLGYHTLFLTGFDILSEADQRWIPALEGAYDEITSWLPTPVLAERTRAMLGSPGPWFLWIHPREAHLPYEVATGFAPGDSVEARYDAACRFLDGVLGPLLASVPPDVWVIFAADHGEDLPSEHGFISHGAAVYESACHVPLVIRGPGVREGRIEHLASLVDLYPTILGMAGIAEPPQSDGLSLLPAVLRDPAYLGRRDAVFVERRYGNVLDPVPNPMRAMISGTRKIIVTERPRALEAYDLAADPGESRNLFLTEPDASHALYDLMNRRFRARMGLWQSDGVAGSIDYDAALGGDPTRLVELATSGDPRVRRLAARDLSHAPPAELRADLLRLAGSDDANVRAWAAVGLGRLATGDETWPFELALKGPLPLARESALEILMAAPRPDAAPALTRMFNARQPSLSWKAAIALNRLGHLQGVRFTAAAFREADAMMLGVNSIVAQIGKHPRPEFPDLLEELYRGKGSDVTLSATLVAIAAELPSEQMLRILEGIDRAYPQLADDIRNRRETIRAAMATARAKYAPGAGLPAIDEGVFDVAWKMMPGVSFVVPPEGALDPDEWKELHETYPVRVAKKPEIHVQFWRSQGPRLRAFLQMYSLDSGKVRITADSPEVELPFEKGPNVLAFTIPPASQEGSVRISVRVEGSEPPRFGFRELVLAGE